MTRHPNQKTLNLDDNDNGNDMALPWMPVPRGPLGVAH